MNNNNNNNNYNNNNNIIFTEKNENKINSFLRNDNSIGVMNEMADFSMSMIIDKKKKDNNEEYRLTTPAGIKRGVWQKDENAPVCTKCFTPFKDGYYVNFFPSGRHHCRFCGLIFCDNCSVDKRDVIPNDLIVKEDFVRRARSNYEVIRDLFSIGRNIERQRTCEACHKLILEYNKIREEVMFFTACEFDVLQYEKIRLMCRKYFYASNVMLGFFRQIQYKMPYQHCNAIEVRLLWINFKYMSGHSKYLVQLLRVCNNNQEVQRVKQLLETNRYKRTISCRTMLCTHKCTERFHHSDIINIIMHYIERCKQIEKYQERDQISDLSNLADFALENFECTDKILKLYIPLLINVCQYDTVHHKVRNFLLQRFVCNSEMLAILYFEVLYYVKCGMSIDYYIDLMGIISQCTDATPKILQRILGLAKDEEDNSNDYDCQTRAISSNILGSTVTTINYTIVPRYSRDQVENSVNTVKDLEMRLGEMIDPLDTKTCIKTMFFSKTETYTSKTKPVKIPYLTYKGQYKAMMFKREGVRQDQIAIYITRYIEQILGDAGYHINFVTYEVLPISKDCGFIEIASESSTVENISREYGDILNYLTSNNREQKYDETRDAFIKSVAAFCIISYCLGVGDRHLGNLMINKKGHLFNIDFGYIFGKDPSTRFTMSGIRLTADMIKVIGNRDSENYKLFEKFCVTLFRICRREVVIIWRMLSMLTNVPDINVTQEEIDNFINERYYPGDSDEEAIKNFLFLMRTSETFSQKMADYAHTISGSGSKVVSGVVTGIASGTTNVKDTVFNSINYLGDKMSSFWSSSN